MELRRTTLVGAILMLPLLLVACVTAAPESSPTPSAQLPDTVWVLEALNGSALIEGTRITLNFDEISVEGSAGCNTYGGSYTVSEDGLHLGDLYATEMGCPEPQGVLEQETAYLQALNAAARFQLADDRLVVVDASGAQILVFVAATTVSQEPTKSITPEPQGSDLTAQVDVPTSLASGETVQAVFTLTNTSSDGFYVLKWFTPLEGIAGDIFRVERDGAELAYRGKMVKRGPPIAEDYVWLEAGASVSAEVDLAEGYDFSQAGQYTIQFRSPQISQVAKTETEMADSFEELGMIQIPSNTANVVIESTSGSGDSQSTAPSTPTPTSAAAEATPVAPITIEPPAGFRVYQDAVAGVAIDIPESWVVTGIIPGQYAILQSYPDDKYVGGEGRQPGDTKCDLNIRPPGTNVADVIPKDRSDPPVTVLSEQEIVLQSGLPGIRVEVDSMGRSLSLIAEVNERAVTLTCFGEPAPFDAIAVSLSAADVADDAPPPATEPGVAFKQYRDSETGVSVLVPQNWVVTGIVPGQWAILQSYPEDKYVGGEGRAPGDTKCDLNIRPYGTSADLIEQWKSNPDTAIIAEGEILLQSGQTGTVIEAENRGRSLSLISDVNGWAVALTCWGELEPFDAISVTLSAAPAPDQPSVGSETYQDQETGVSVLVPENWVVTGIVPGHKATLQSGDTQCDLLIRPAETSMAQLVQEMRTNTAITILSDVELTLASGEPGIKMEQESMVGRSLLLFTEVNERAVVLACYGDFAPFDEIALTIGASE
jgi:heat shock protein HslJ